MKFLQRVNAIFRQHTAPETGNSVDVVKDKYSAYSVVHYPLSGKFYPKKKGRSLKQDYRSGIIQYAFRLSNGEDELYADSFYLENDAWAFIDKAIEQMDKVNVRVLTRKET